MDELIILALMWTAYCTIHSLLIADSMKSFAEAYLKGRFRYYRIFFNVVSAILLIPILLYRGIIESPPIFTYRGPWVLIQIFLLSCGICLFYLGARAYDMKEFLGLKQLKGEENEEAEGLETKGILGFVRHPWYLGGIMIIWGRNLSAKVLTTNIVLTAYFIVGSYLEERKLMRHFGTQYEKYKEEVSMLIPVKWARKKFRGSEDQKLGR